MGTTYRPKYNAHVRMTPPKEKESHCLRSVTGAVEIAIVRTAVLQCSFKANFPLKLLLKFSTSTALAIVNLKYPKLH